MNLLFFRNPYYYSKKQMKTWEGSAFITKAEPLLTVHKQQGGTFMNYP